jgi:pectin methylesterase-like acyl-CoA thioesterase
MDRPQPYGFVFFNCKLTGDPTPWIDPTNTPAAKSSKQSMADLGRPWRPYASVTYLNCWMDAHISPAGWNNWRNPTNELTARYAEYRSTGPGANPAQRVKWSKQLTKEEADKITVESVLAGSDGWNPAKREI